MSVTSSCNPWASTVCWGETFSCCATDAQDKDGGVRIWTSDGCGHDFILFPVAPALADLSLNSLPLAVAWMQRSDRDPPPRAVEPNKFHTWNLSPTSPHCMFSGERLHEKRKIAYRKRGIFIKWHFPYGLNLHYPEVNLFCTSHYYAGDKYIRLYVIVFILLLLFSFLIDLLLSFLFEILVLKRALQIHFIWFEIFVKQIKKL